MRVIENQSALIWTSTDIKFNAQVCLTKSEQEKLYEIIGESDDDLIGYLESIIEENEEAIISFISEIICESIKEELKNHESNSE